MVNLRSTFTGLQSSPRILSVSNDISVARRSLHWLNWNRGRELVIIAEWLVSVLLSVYCARSVNPKLSFTICLLRSGLWDLVI